MRSGSSSTAKVSKKRRSRAYTRSMNRPLLCVLLAISVDVSADRRREIEKAVAAAPAARLEKLAVRPTMKAIFPALHTCYQREVDRGAAGGLSCIRWTAGTSVMY